MSLHDPTPHRVSACPVHFLWDGRGVGRVLVRSGFLGFLAAGALGTGARFLHVDWLGPASWGVLGVALAAWTAGQASSFFVARRASRST